MPSDVPRRKPGKLRRWFRRLRITLLLLLLAFVGGLIFLQLVGLPEFLRRPLLQQLRDRGLDLKMSNVRWHFYRGIVAENVTFNQMGNTNNPRFAAEEVDLNLDYRALSRFAIEVTGVGIDKGKMTVPVADTNQPAREMKVERIRAHLLFLPGDAVSLDDFHAQFAGADFSVSGVITNASAMRYWPIFMPGEPKKGRAEPKRLRQLADALEKIHFAKQPNFRVMLSGDGRDPQSFMARLTLDAPAADTPWGNLTNGVFTLSVFPASAAMPSVAELTLHAIGAHTPWAEVRDFDMTMHLAGAEAGTNVVHAELEMRATHVTTPWATATNVTGIAHWVHSLTNAIPLSGNGEVRADFAVTKWAGATNISFRAALNTLTNPPLADPAWGRWECIRPFELGWSARVAALDTEKLGAEEVVCSGNWSAPLLSVTNLMVRFTDGQLNGRAKLNVATRLTSFEAKSDFDAHKVSPLLTPGAARWLAKYTWGPPPHFTGSGVLTLPAWTNQQVNWRTDVEPTLKLAGFLTATNCAYLGAPASWVRTHLSYTNQVWRLPDLVAGRPEGTLRLSHVANDRTHEYYFGIHSTISPDALRPLLSTNAQRGLNFFKLSKNPVVEGGIWGRWREPDSIGVTGRVALANFSFREQSVDSFSSLLRYTNRVLEFLDPRLLRGTQSVVAPGITADFNAQRVYLTNCLSTIEPVMVARAIGPKTARTLEPYQFKLPPVVRAHGYAPLADISDVDLHFDVNGGPFAWSYFRVQNISGQVDWRGDTLSLANMNLAGYDGLGAGWANFNFAAPRGAEFQFGLAITNVDLQLLMADLSTRTNSLEGRLSGTLLVTNANTENTFSWSGQGDARLQNGLIWSLPVFGVLSKPLEGIKPGLGSTRFSEAAAGFTITNGVIFSKNLEMRAPTMRLRYEGTVDFDGRVDTRVEGQPFRDAWVIGPIISTVLWPMTKLFEYHVTGTLNEPKADTVFIPRLIMHPFQTFEEFFSGAGGKTNAPPPPKPPP